MSGQQTGNATVDLAGGNTERVATPPPRRLGAPVDAYPGLIGSHIRGRARLAARDELHTAPARRRVAGNLYAIDATSARWHEYCYERNPTEVHRENYLELAALANQHGQLRLVVRPRLDGLDLVHDHHRHRVQDLAEDDVPARSIAVARLGPNGLKIEKETTHDLV